MAYVAVVRAPRPQQGVPVSPAVCFHARTRAVPESPMPRRPHLNTRQYRVGFLWALVALAALATLPSLAPSGGRDWVLAAGADGLSPQDEAAARYQAWLRGRAAAQDTAAGQAAASQAASGPGASAPTPTVTMPAASDADIPALALRAYREAESWASGFDSRCNLSWTVLAGIGRIESNHGRHLGSLARFSPSGDVTPSILGPVLNGALSTAAIHDTDAGRWDGDAAWDRAVGPMQFIPSTWRTLGRDGNGDGVANPNNLFDSAVSAAGYLCLSSGGSLSDQGNLRRAVYAYNHSWDYVAAVLTWASFYQQRAGLGSLVEVQVPAGPASPPSLAAGGGATGTGGGGGTGGAAAGTGTASSPGGVVAAGGSGSPSSPAAPGGSPSGSSTSTSGSDGLTGSPATAPPSTSAPTTAPPTTAPPSTSPPTTAPPTTAPPSTDPPTTTTLCPPDSTTTSSTTTTTTDTTTTTTTPTCPS